MAIVRVHRFSSVCGFITKLITGRKSLRNPARYYTINRWRKACDDRNRQIENQ